MHTIKKRIIGVLGVLGLIAVTHANGVITIPSNMSTIIPNLANKTNSIYFNRWWNDFQWIIIWNGTQTLNTPQIVTYGSTTVSCNKKVAWVYYNNQRWARRWPLDNITHTALINTDSSYNNIQLAWWLFTNCGWNTNAVYGQLTHILTGTLSGEYKLAAWLIYDFGSNNYQTLWTIDSLTLNSNQWNWYIYDSAWWIGQLWSNTQWTNNQTGSVWWIGGGIINGISVISWWTTSGINSTIGSTITQTTGSITRLCNYDNVPYVANGPFSDTLTHRGFPYIEILRISCLNQGRWRAKGLWEYQPNANITRVEVLKTISKIVWSTLDNFPKINEQNMYTGNKPFIDTPNRFNHYADFAFKQGLVEWLYTTDKYGNRYLNPDQAITRYEAIKIMMLAYNKISQSMANITWPSVMGDVINPDDPYYSYVRQAEVLGFISGVPQKDGGYNFEGMRNLTRAEFAKIVGLPFADQLFDIEQVIYQSELYNDIIDALNTTTTNRKVFIQAFYEQISTMDEVTFIKKYKVQKQLFLETLYDTVVAPILWEYTWPTTN